MKIGRVTKSRENMTILKSFCFCFTPKTGSVVLGCLGIIFAVLMIVPPCLILDNHDFYFSEYIRQQKSYGGKRILKTLYKGNFEYNAEVIYSLFIQWRSLDKKGIDYLSNSLWTIIITLWGSLHDRIFVESHELWIKKYQKSKGLRKCSRINEMQISS